MRTFLLFVCVTSVVGGGCLPISLEGRRCDSSGDCLQGFVCQAEVCVVVDPGVGEACASDEDCAAGAHCAFDTCRPGEQNPSADELLNDDCAAIVSDQPADEIAAIVADATTVQLIGSVLPLTKDGAANDAGVGRQRAMELATRQVNRAGGVFGRELAVLSCDSRGNVEDAARALAHLAAAGIPLVVGEAASGITETIFREVARPAGMMMIAPSSTSVNLTGIDDDGLLFRTTVSDVRQGPALASFLLAGNFQRIAVVASSETYGSSLRASVRSDLCGAGGYPCANASRYLPVEFAENPTQAEIDDVIARLDTFDPQIILLAGQDVEVAPFLTTIGATTGLDAARILLTDTAKKNAILAALPAQLAERIVGTAPAEVPDGDTFREFVLEFDTIFAADDGDAFGPQVYDATVVAALAHVASGDDLHPRGASLALAVPELATKGAPVAGVIGVDENGLNSLQRAIGTLLDGQPVDLDGASGPIDFDEAGDVLGDIELWRRCETAAGEAAVSLGVMLSATGAFELPPEQCPSCAVLGCPADAVCKTIFGLEGRGTFCMQRCELDEPCTTRVGRAGRCGLLGDDPVCASDSELGGPCGALSHSFCGPTAATCLLITDPPDPAEGFCARPCNPADPTTCLRPNTPANLCGCGDDGALACSNDLFFDGGDGVCAPPTEVGDACREVLTEQAIPCTGDQTCDAATDTCEAN